MECQQISIFLLFSSISRTSPSAFALPRWGLQGCGYTPCQSRGGATKSCQFNKNYFVNNSIAATREFFSPLENLPNPTSTTLVSVSIWEEFCEIKLKVSIISLRKAWINFKTEQLDQLSIAWHKTEPKFSIQKLSRFSTGFSKKLQSCQNYLKHRVES